MATLVFKVSTAKDTFSQGLIPIDLKVHAEARNLEEDWSGKSSRNERRRLQNLLNQRAYRRRRAAEKSRNQQSYDLHEPTSDVCASSAAHPNVHANRVRSLTATTTPNPGPSHHETARSTVLSRKSNSQPAQPSPTSWCRELEDSLAKLGLDGHVEAPISRKHGQEASDAVQFEEAFLAHPDASNIFPLAADHLLSLMYYNVFRALVRNVESLFLSMDLMHANSYPSPFISNTINAIEDFSSIPPQFSPTLIQRTVPHHPCFDIFPDPALRDNGILHCGQLPHGKLCLTLAGRETWYERDLLKRNGMVIWADPSTVDSWEVTEGFAQNWPWLVKGAWGLQSSTNAWRTLRGEEPISFA